ncbi:hypothetical protein P879_04094, partial [Paragonimus westermani]
HIENLPPELYCKPEPLAVLSGLDIENNTVHLSIWRAFTMNTGRDRDPFKFRCLPVDHQFPKPKFKPVGAHEWLLPKGILKTGWMRKHLEEIPAVVAVFYDLDWSDNQWEEKSTECAQRVETVRSKLVGRDCKLVVVLIQKRAPLPSGEDPIAMERAQALCTKCDLPGKNLFALSHTNHLCGCVTSLESEFRDMALSYYHQRAKKVKAHKDSLNKTSHQLLFVRHEFKIAFFGELKQDQALALKHYQQAYTHLLEQRIVDIHLLEMKTVAGFINYKICRLAFQTNASDAISQFRRHIEFFSNLVGMPQLAFEHEAWMSKQFEILGDLFQEAIQSSLTALMTQHPGLYYQEAARHAIARRQICQALCSHSNVVSTDPVPIQEESVSGTDLLDPQTSPIYSHSPPDQGLLSSASVGTVKTKRKNFSAIESVRPNSPLRFARRSAGSSPASPVGRSPPLIPLNVDMYNAVSATEKVDGLEFYGQRPWRQGVQSSEPPSTTKEREGIRALQRAELAVDHSERIIPLLEQTHLHYKRYKAERMKLYPVVLMGAEYYRKGMYAKALSCYSSVLDKYRREGWWTIYTSVLRHILKCAYLMGQIDTFLSAGLELMGPSSSLSGSDKRAVQQVLFQLFQGIVPDVVSVAPELGQASEETVKLWQQNLDALDCDTSAVTAAESLNENIAACIKDEGQTQNKNSPSKRQFSLNVSRLHVCIECKVAFAEAQFTVDRPVQLVVFLRINTSGNRFVNFGFVESTAPLALDVHRVNVNFLHQSWSVPFRLESSDSIKAVLLCLDPHSLGQLIKVDTVQVDVSTTSGLPPTVGRKSVVVTLVWSWSTPDEFAWSSPTSSHVKSRPAHLDHTNRSASFPLTPAGLWDSASFPSALERRFQQAQSVSVPHPNGLCEITIPSFPPKWDLIGERLQTEVGERKSGLEVRLAHTPPALTREIYTIECSVTNTESVTAEKLNLSVDVSEKVTGGSLESDVTTSRNSKPKEPDELAINDTSMLTAAIPSGPSMQVISTSSLDDLLPAEDRSYFLFIRCSTPGERSLCYRLTYLAQFPSPTTPNLLVALEPRDGMVYVPRVLHVDEHSHAVSDGHIECRCVRTGLTEFGALLPFEVAWQTMSIHQSPISDLIVGEPFLMQAHLTNSSPWNLKVLDTTFELTPPVIFVDGEQDVQIKDLSVRAGDRVSQCQVLKVTQVNQENEIVNLGLLKVRWYRDAQLNDTDRNIVITTFQLLSCCVLELPVRVRAEIPSISTVLVPMRVQFGLENRTIYPQELLVQMESAPHFMISGQIKLRLRLLPGSPQLLQYILLPLHAGHLALPRLRLTLSANNASSPEEQQTLRLHMEEKMLRQIPTHVFVVPSGKRNSDVIRDSIFAEQLVPTL